LNVTVYDHFDDLGTIYLRMTYRWNNWESIYNGYIWDNKFFDQLIKHGLEERYEVRKKLK
jgi:hypothetical protein